ncbi:uncharacterized protein RVIR1_13990 [Candidatus Rickettsiella viridis]|uniref:Uncharacterized protein n=1 Tax=Candidatus Rickettsiella viridis TaxID=676208 RepID=A0A2Z5UWL7_9COXI|nr:DUF5397 family protein [Candidatus Rickettsiella viridis]BBB15844.1 uncharacterized protein RVIR1_13990 [Candidatus Rickettsiella viridis]
MLRQLNISTYKISPEQVKNTFRRFGPYGPVYQVIGISRESNEGEILMNIHIFETKENLEYPFSHILNDPLE